MNKTTLEMSGSEVLESLNPSSACIYFCPEESKRNEQQTYYIARRPSAFREVVLFLENGNLQRPIDLTIDMWLDEILFYKIADLDNAIRAR